MRVLPFVWIVVTIPLGLAVLVASYIQGAVVAVWFDDRALTDPVTVVPEWSLAALGPVLMICGAIAVGTSMRRVGRDTGGQGGAERTVALGRFASIWMVLTAVVGVAIVVTAYLDRHLHDQWFNSQTTYSHNMSIVPVVILWILGAVLVIGGSYVSWLAVRGRGRPASVRLRTSD